MMISKKILFLSALTAATLSAAPGVESVRPTNAPPAAAGPQGLRPSLNPEASFTPEQSKAYHEALDSSREQMGSSWQKLRTTRRELEELVKAEKLDENAIRAKAAELGKIEGDLAVTKAKILDHLRPLFSAEQLAQLARTPQLNGVTLPPRRLGTNEANLRPRIQRPSESAPVPTPAPGK